MFIDVTGVKLIPGNNGDNCPGNGETFDENGELIGMCCDECNFLMCCLPGHDKKKCIVCKRNECPRAGKGY